jgi:hypothetical protein
MPCPSGGVFWPILVPEVDFDRESYIPVSSLTLLTFCFGQIILLELLRVNHDDAQQ